MKNQTLTIFTPTYNRCNKLKRLYQSLSNQTCKRFIWIIVDDGSNDDTRFFIQKITKEANFEIRYYWQINSGKSMAHNLGVRLTTTELFTCVDSDDYLSRDAVEVLIKKWSQRTAQDVGILARREVTKVKNSTKDGIHTTLRDSNKKYGIKGDTMLIFKTEILKKYKFPYFQNEKFVPENYLYDLIDKEGTLLFFDKVLYFGEYLEDGYTNNMAKLIKKNPYGYLAYIKQRLSFDKTMTDTIADTIRYIAISYVIEKEDVIKDSINPFLTILCLPLGKLFFIKRYKNI